MKVNRRKAASAATMAAVAVSETSHSYYTLTLACMTAIQGRIVSRASTNLHNTHRTPRPMSSFPRFVHLAFAVHFQERRQHCPVIIVNVHFPRRPPAVLHLSTANTAP